VQCVQGKCDLSFLQSLEKIKKDISDSHKVKNQQKQSKPNKQIKLKAKAYKYTRRNMLLTMMKSTTMIMALCYATVYVSAKESSLRGGRDLQVVDGEDAYCNVNVTLTCPIAVPITLDNDCLDPFQVMHFRYNGGDCSQSDNLEDRQEFTCTDFTNNNTTQQEVLSESYIVVTSRSSDEIYFSGSVAVGEEYTLNANEEYSVLDGEMTITIFDSEGGNILQTTDLLLDCTNPLFLFDKFGSSQVTAWREISGREVSSQLETDRTGTIGVVVNNFDSSNPIRLVEMTLISNIQDMPIEYTSEVQGNVLETGSELQLPGYKFNYDLITRTRYTFFTTIIAEPIVDGDVDGDETNQCNGHHFIECIL
jgi:hypothetical protein